MTVTLSPELASYVEERVRAGAFSSPDDAVNRLLAFVVAGLQIEEKELERLRAEIAVGMADVERGNVAEWDADEIWAEAERLDAEERAKKAG